MTDDTRRLVLLAAKRLPAAALDLVKESFDVRDTDEAEIREGIENCSPVALICTVDVNVDASLIAALPKSVQAIGTYSVGLDHIDQAAAAERGLAVCATPGALAEAVAEIALFLLLGAARRGRESTDLLASGQWTGWSPDQLLGVSLSGRRLGIFGMGEIGLEAAKRAQAFGMEVNYHNRRERSEAHEIGLTYVEDVQRFLSLSDVLLLTCPLTDDTRGFVNEASIGFLPEGAIVVNVSRGGIIDDAALIAALRSGRIRAAGLDVFANEPDLNPAYRDLPNVFATPHIGSSTDEARRAMMAKLVSGIGEVCS